MSEISIRGFHSRRDFISALALAYRSRDAVSPVRPPLDPLGALPILRRRGSCDSFHSLRPANRFDFQTSRVTRLANAGLLARQHSPEPFRTLRSSRGTPVMQIHRATFKPWLQWMLPSGQENKYVQTSDGKSAGSHHFLKITNTAITINAKPAR